MPITSVGTPTNNQCSMMTCCNQMDQGTVQGGYNSKTNTSNTVNTGYQFKPLGNTLGSLSAPQLPKTVQTVLPPNVQTWLDTNVKGAEAQKAIHAVYQDPKGDGKKLIQALVSKGVTMDLNNFDNSSTEGYYDPETNRITLKSGMSEEAQVMAAIHEGLHAIVDSDDGSKEEEAYNNVIADQMGSRIFGKTSNQTPQAIFQETLALYPELPDSGPYAQPLAASGINLSDYWPA